MYLHDWVLAKIKVTGCNWLAPKKCPNQFALPSLLEDFFIGEMHVTCTNLKGIPLAPSGEEDGALRSPCTKGHKELGQPRETERLLFH